MYNQNVLQFQGSDGWIAKWFFLKNALKTCFVKLPDFNVIEWIRVLALVNGRILLFSLIGSLFHFVHLESGTALQWMNIQCCFERKIFQKCTWLDIFYLIMKSFYIEVQLFCQHAYFNMKWTYCLEGCLPLFKKNRKSCKIWLKLSYIWLD